MSTLKVNNLEPTSGTVVIINADTKIISATGKEIDLGGATNDFSGSLNVTGSITNIDGDIIVNKGNFQLKSGSLFIGTGSLNVGYTSGSTSSSYWSITSSVILSGSTGFEGDTTVTGSFECTGSADFEGDTTVTGSFECTGSADFEGDTTVTGSFEVEGDATITGDMIISGCFDIACYQDADNPVFYGIEGRTTAAPAGFEYISINYSTYGNLTASLNAATGSSQLVYIQSASVIIPFAIAGISFEDDGYGGGVTYVSASGPDIPFATIVQIGFPQPLAGVGVATYIVTTVVNPDVSQGGRIYQIDGQDKPYLNFIRGGVYTFDVSDSTNGTHPLRFRVGGVGSAQFTQGVVVTGTQGQPGATVVFTVPNNAPNTLEYYCTNHQLYMGNEITISAGVIAIGTGSSTPVASFCCEEITLSSDTVISGSLDVTGPANFQDGLIVSGCIEMYCPGDETTAWYGYKGNTRFSKSSASVFINYAHLDQSYGDVRTYISASAASNLGTLQLYNTVTGTTQTVSFVTSSWTGQLTLIEYVTNTLTNFSPVPGPIIHIGNQTPDLQPNGADVLMGSGSDTPVQTAQFCCDGNILFGDSTMSGSLTVTDGATVTGSVTISGSVSDDVIDIKIPVGITSPVTITGPLTVSGSIIDDKVDIRIPIGITSPVTVSGSLTIASGSLFDGKGGGKVTGSFSVSGSLTANTITATQTLVINNVLEDAPSYSGSNGETLYVAATGHYMIYAFLEGAWRSGSLS